MLAVQKLSKEGRKMGSKELNSKQQPRDIVDGVVETRSISQDKSVFKNESRTKDLNLLRDLARRLLGQGV